jgi:hypothetical protein
VAYWPRENVRDGADCSAPTRGAFSSVERSGYSGRYGPTPYWRWLRYVILAWTIWLIVGAAILIRISNM